MDCLDSLGKFLTCPFWDFIQTWALIATLGFIIWYTHSTHEIMKLQKEEIGLKKRPIVSFTIEEQRRDNNGMPLKVPSNFYCSTFITSHNLVHAKYRVEAIIEINSKRLKLDPNTHYAGDRIWELQAGTTSPGHLDLDDILRKNNIRGFRPESSRAMIYFKSWAVNYYEKNDSLKLDINRNPDSRWNWSHALLAWIPQAISDEDEIIE